MRLSLTVIATVFGAAVTLATAAAFPSAGYPTPLRSAQTTEAAAIAAPPPLLALVR